VSKIKILFLPPAINERWLSDPRDLTHLLPGTHADVAYCDARYQPHPPAPDA
jgi:hypothetical protein